jgi:hypothetical protein
MCPKEDNAATKSNNMIHVVNVQWELKYIFYLKFPVHVSMVKLDIDGEKIIFAVYTRSRIMIHIAVCSDLS